MTKWLSSMTVSALLLASPTSGPAMAAESQAALKTAIVYNILRFAAFGGPAAATRTLCVNRVDPLATALSSLDGKPLEDSRLAVRRIAASDLTGCDALFLSNGAPAGAPGVLMIGDAPDFVARGGAVGLVQFGRQIRFRIAPEAARRADVTFSSRLLRLAIVDRG